MARSWNEIRDRAIHFAHKWKDESREEAEAKSFLDDFFEVFGIPRKRVAVSNQVTQNINKWMKLIGEKLELSVLITTYTARHTFPLLSNYAKPTLSLLKRV